jgi:hypothetical protein
MRPLIPPPYSSTLYKTKTPYGYNTVHYSIYGRITAVHLPHRRYLTVATSPSISHYSSCNSSVLKLFSLRHDFIHSIASTVSILIRFRRSDIVIFDEEKSLSGAADIAGIESTSRAILERFGKSLCCVDSSHHLRTSSKSL